MVRVATRSFRSSYSPAGSCSEAAGLTVAAAVAEATIVDRSN